MNIIDEFIKDLLGHLDLAIEVDWAIIRRIVKVTSPHFVLLGIDPQVYLFHLFVKRIDQISNRFYFVGESDSTD